jgi:hypothetical protein
MYDELIVRSFFSSFLILCCASLTGLEGIDMGWFGLAGLD